MWCQILCVGIFAHLSHLINFSFIAFIHCVLVCFFVTTLDADVVTNKRNMPPQSHHDFDFGLRICKHSEVASPVVVTVVCLLYEVFVK